MAVRLVQFRGPDDARALAAMGGDGAARRVAGVESSHALALLAIREGITLADAASA